MNEPAQGPSILIIEDSPTNLELMAYLLEAAGCRTYTATDGSEGLALARAQIPDLVLCDVHMPTMDGYEVARAFSADAKLSGIPLVAVTASTQCEDKERITAAGFHGYIRKPFSLDAFAGQVKAYLPGQERR